MYEEQNNGYLNFLELLGIQTIILSISKYLRVYRNSVQASVIMQIPRKDYIIVDTGVHHPNKQADSGKELTFVRCGTHKSVRPQPYALPLCITLYLSNSSIAT